MMSLHRQNRSRHSAPSRKLSRCHTARFDLEQLETRTFLSAAVESVNGTENNLANTLWGSAGADLIRLAAAAYSDGISAPSLVTDASARAISNILNNQADPAKPSTDIATIDQNSLSDFGYSFGQFIDHDLDNSPNGTTAISIPVAAGDPIGPNALSLSRSVTDPATGTSTSNPAQQTNAVTSYLDLSQVYGSSQIVADALRTFQGGLLKTSPGNMLPYDNTTYFTSAQITALNMANDAHAVPQSQLFATGDVRGNENLELTTLETLFVRNHNAIATVLQKDHPAWTDEQLYQEARKLNIAEYQTIIYTGWIPAVLGPSALPSYTGYNASVNASISNEFSTVAFRFGHSIVSGSIARVNNDSTSIVDVSSTGSNISLAQDFFDPNLLNPTGLVDPRTGHTSTDIGPVLKGEADGVANANDLMAISDIRNLLFGNGGSGGQDLMALDIERARDHGIADYNTLRVDLGLPAVTSFSQITSDVKVQQQLEAAYPGGVNTIDAFEGGLAEDHVAGSDLGPLFQAIIADQFTRLRNGDRFFYLNESFNAEELGIMGQGNTLTKVIEANTNITNLQSDIFHFRASISGTVDLTQNRARDGFGGGSGMGGPRGLVLAGLTLNLEDATGDILATTTTDARGHYIFNQLSGPSANPDIPYGVSGTGIYKVVLVMPASMTAVSPTSLKVNITRGSTNVRDLNFGIASSTNDPADPAHGPWDLGWGWNADRHHA
jgi:hypothetical protein